MKKSFSFFLSAAIAFAFCACSGDAAKQKEAEEAQADANTGATQQYTPAEKNAWEGKKFIEDLAASDSTVVVLPSGLAYKVIKEGKGEKPTATSTVSVKYTGKFANGAVFDTSGDNTINFPLNGVIAGFSEGLQQMTPGSVYTLYIPGDLAYGPNGIPRAGIGPNQMLIFDLELVDIK